jgi:hypothetical protein
VIIDTSALIAILRAEDDANEMALAIERAQVRRISAASYLETAVVIDASRDPIASRRFDELVDTAELRVEPVTREQAGIARETISATPTSHPHCPPRWTIILVDSDAEDRHRASRGAEAREKRRQPGTVQKWPTGSAPSPARQSSTQRALTQQMPPRRNTQDSSADQRGEHDPATAHPSRPG